MLSVSPAVLYYFSVCLRLTNHQKLPVPSTVYIKFLGSNLGQAILSPLMLGIKETVLYTTVHKGVPDP
jgi:hypothetical protein